jgi:hypothetical protein
MNYSPLKALTPNSGDPGATKIRACCEIDADANNLQ